MSGGNDDADVRLRWWGVHELGRGYIAAETGGKAYELLDVDRFPDEFAPPRLRETSVEIFPLWSTWLTFASVIGLLMVEWFVRKLVNLA